MNMNEHRALFLDRDGTLVYPRHYPSTPKDLRLYEDIGDGLRCLQRAGFRLIVVTNQSGIARGYFTEAELECMHAHLERELARQAVRLDGIYYCPHHVDGAIPELAIRCGCRKPQPGMLTRAADELDLDLASSWMIGDILDDIEAGNRAGCTSILVDLGTEPLPQTPLRKPTVVARNTRHALAIVAALEGVGPYTELKYRPARWMHVVPPAIDSRSIDESGVNTYTRHDDLNGFRVTARQGA